MPSPPAPPLPPPPAPPPPSPSGGDSDGSESDNNRRPVGSSSSLHSPSAPLASRQQRQPPSDMQHSLASALEAVAMQALGAQAAGRQTGSAQTTAPPQQRAQHQTLQTDSINPFWGGQHQQSLTTNLAEDQRAFHELMRSALQQQYNNALISHFIRQQQQAREHAMAQQVLLRLQQQQQQQQQQQRQLQQLQQQQQCRPPQGSQGPAVPVSVPLYPPVVQPVKAAARDHPRTGTPLAHREPAAPIGDLNVAELEAVGAGRAPKRHKPRHSTRSAEVSLAYTVAVGGSVCIREWLRKRGHVELNHALSRARRL